MISLSPSILAKKLNCLYFVLRSRVLSFFLLRVQLGSSTAPPVLGECELTKFIDDLSLSSSFRLFSLHFLSSGSVRAIITTTSVCCVFL